MSPLHKRMIVSLEAALWLLALGGLVSFTQLRSANREVEKPAAKARVPGVTRALADSAYLGTVASIVSKIASRDPFRVSHAPATVLYSPELRANAPAAQPRPVVARPTLSVRGILGGGNFWRAALMGVPGRSEAVLVTSGDTLGGLRVRRITRDTVFVRGADTSWALPVRGGWQP